MTVAPLEQLIRQRMDEHGWSLGQLVRRSNGGLTKGRWQQLSTGARMTGFPEPRTIKVLAEVLEVTETTVVLSTAATLGLDVRSPESSLAQLLPVGTDRLPERMRDAILNLIRAALAATS